MKFLCHKPLELFYTEIEVRMLINASRQFINRSIDFFYSQVL